MFFFIFKESKPKVKTLLHSHLNLENQQLVNCLFETRHLLLAITNREGLIRRVNKSFTAFFGDFRDSEKSEPSLFELWSGNINDLEDAFRGLEKEEVSTCTQLLAGVHEKKNFEIELKKIDTELVLIEFKDLDEVESSKIAEAKARLEASEQRKNVQELAAVVSHDLRAPVANMAYLMSLFKKNDISQEEFKPFMEALQISAHRTLEAIDGLGGKLNYDLQNKNQVEVIFQELIDSVLLKFKDTIESSQAKIRVETRGLVSCKIEGEALKMILSQLLSNSLKFARKGVRPEIVIICKQEGESCIIQIKDNGTGIDLEGNRERLFGLFQTFHDRPDARGLGLYQVKNRLKSLGGDIRLESTKGLGTIVTLIFKANEFEKASMHY